jgi:hypothetical protein
MATGAATSGGTVHGLRGAKAAFQALPQVAKDRFLHATTVTVKEIVRGAQARLEASPSIQTRNLYRHVASTVSKATGRGRVGISTGTTTISNIALRKKVRVKGVIVQDSRGRQRIDRPSRRAHFIEFGTRRQEAEPFMLPAAEAEKDSYRARAVAAGKQIEADVAAVGARNL